MNGLDSKKVVLGLSGGIDSAASALLLKETGMQVHALYFDVTDCGNTDAKSRAEALCSQLGISFRYINLSDRFEKIIIEPFCKAYLGGCTPMPCMVCNPYIKWAVLKEYADEIGAYYLATGHYARTENIDGTVYIKRSENTSKDQSYMLARLGQDILSRALFPLSGFADKAEVKAYIMKKGIIIPENLKESQDICFISGDYRDFIASREISSAPGNFIDERGQILGRHSGYASFTVGQGKGFGMGFNKKLYVKSINTETGDVVLCEDPALYTDTVDISICNFAGYGEIDYIPDEYMGEHFDVKIRYTAKPADAVLFAGGERGLATLKFKDLQRGPTPGQYAVFYKNDLVIGCGIIS